MAAAQRTPRARSAAATAAAAEPADEAIDTTAPEAPSQEQAPEPQEAEQPRRRPWRFVSPLDGAPLGAAPGVAPTEGQAVRTRRLGPARKDIVR